MLFHIKTKRPNRWPSSVCILRASSLAMIVVLLLVNGSEAIVKQQQRSDDLPQPQQINNNGQQQHQSSAYQNHKSLPASGSSSVSSSSSSSSSSSLSSANSPTISSPAQSSPSQPLNVGSSVPNSISSAGAQQQQHSSGQPSYSSSISVSAASPQPLNGGSSSSNSGRVLDPMSGYGSYAPMQKSSQYGMDNMAAAASNQDQSYQAAANSVNMALANSGIFGPSSGPSGNSQQQSGASSPQSLNPLHYFYYPAKDSSNAVPSSSASTASGAAGKNSGVDMMNAASNNYQSLAYPSYADQSAFNSALSSLGSSPDSAASNQDSSYMGQSGLSAQGPESNQGNSMYNNLNQNQNNNNLGHQSYNGDLSGYASNINSQQSSPSQQGAQQQPQQQNSSPGSISFNGPSNGNNVPDSYMNSHLGSSQSHQQVPMQPSMSAYQNSLYNQMGDLSTSNFGNNANAMSSVASYMSPNQPVDHGNAQHDLFSNSNSQLFGQQANQGNQHFSSAASQLSPAAVSPPSGQQPSIPSSASSLFSAASSLFGPSQGGSSSQQGQQGSNANSLFGGQQYLNSFLQPQYNQFGNQQLGNNMEPLSVSGSAGSVSQAVAPQQSSGSSHRFGIKSFIIPMLAAAGLSLLIPTMSSIGTAVGRKKRSIDDRTNNRFDPFNGASQMAKELSIGEYMDKIERYYSIYKNAVENDDCLNRLICEFGDAVKDVTVGKVSPVITVIEKLAPAWMTGKVHLFKEATLDTGKEGKEKCKKYVCHSNKHQQH